MKIKPLLRIFVCNFFDLTSSGLMDPNQIMHRKSLSSHLDTADLALSQEELWPGPGQVLSVSSHHWSYEALWD